MKICYCDVNNQFARYLHEINHPLVKEHTAFRNHKRTAFYYWRVTERRLTYSDDYVGMATQVSLGEFIGNIVSLRDNPELIIPLMLFGGTPINIKLNDETTYSLNNTNLYHLQLLKCFQSILDNFAHIIRINVCQTPPNESTFFIAKRSNFISINAWKSQQAIGRYSKNRICCEETNFLSTLASLFKDKQLIYNLLTNLCGYFKIELLNEKELSSLIKYFKDHYGNTNQLQEEDTNFTNRSSTGECRSYGQGSEVAVRFGHLSNRARIVASTSNCHIITTEISTKCSRDS